MDNLNSATESEQLLHIAKLLGLKPQCVVPLQEQSKVLKCTVKCKLCGTVTIQYSKLVKHTNGVWIRTEDINEPTALLTKDLLEEYKTLVKSCFNCKEVLLQKSKEELVHMVLVCYTTPLSRSEVIKKLIQNYSTGDK